MGIKKLKFLNVKLHVFESKNGLHIKQLDFRYFLKFSLVVVSRFFIFTLVLETEYSVQMKMAKK